MREPHWLRPLARITRPFAALGFALVLWLLAAASQARAAQDVVHFGDAIQVGQGETIHDAVCFFCSVHIKGAVKGDVVVFFGDVQIDGSADHDVVNFFGQVKAADETNIGHDLVNFFGGVRLGKHVTVGEDAVVMFGNLRAEDSASVGGSRVVEGGVIFWVPFLLIAGVVSFMVQEMRWRRRRRLLRGY